jgi:hypothetical protein
MYTHTCIQGPWTILDARGVSKEGHELSKNGTFMENSLHGLAEDLQPDWPEDELLHVRLEPRVRIRSVHVCLCVCVCVCAWKCMHVSECVCVCVYNCMHVRERERVCVCRACKCLVAIGQCLHVCLYICMCVCLHTCKFLVAIDQCLHVCLCVSVCVYL